MTSPQVVGVDVGGSKVSALRVSLTGEVLARDLRTTPSHDQDAILDTMQEAAHAVMTSGVIAVGAGAAGMVGDDGVLIYAPNLAWRNVPLAERLRTAFGLPVAVDNDCTAATFGELRLGALRGVHQGLYVGVGTGIGGGLVVHGRVWRGEHGYAAEIGHFIVDPAGPECGCGNRGCWETVASGSAIEADGRRAVARHAHSLIAELAGGDETRVTGALVTEAASRGDPAARGILAEVGHRFGEGLAGLANILDPELIVVGGGVAGVGEMFLGPARAAFAMAAEASDLRPRVPIVEASLGADAAAIGAAMLALDALA
jgi:glucokinase